MKAIIRVDYMDYVLEVEDAVKIMKFIEGAEVYETKYVNNASTYFVYKQDPVKAATMVLIPDELYRMAKLAGKPA